MKMEWDILAMSEVRWKGGMLKSPTDTYTIEGKNDNKWND